MEAKERSGEGLKKRIAARQTGMLHALSDLLDGTIPPPRDQRDAMTVLARQLRAQVGTQQLVRGCEDLLTLVRWMQERWLFGNLAAVGADGGVEAGTERDAREIVEALGRLDGLVNGRGGG